MRIAVEGCCHGDLDKIYATIEHAQRETNTKIDLLICCGDFESVRNDFDLKSMNVPQKYLSYKDFYKYYSGECTAPVPTLFIGGNHEASNYLWELYYGGFVAPNIYYLGHSGVIRFKGLRIAGVSGIYKPYSFHSAYVERVPYDARGIRSVYHTRSFEIFKLYQLMIEKRQSAPASTATASPHSPLIDVMLSHDWPASITKHGNVGQLVRWKPHFRSDIDRGELGSPASDVLLNNLQPRYWFSGHLHCKFPAVVPHGSTTQNQQTPNTTRFLALDKCLPRRDFLQFIDIEPNHPYINDTSEEPCFEYDLEWLSIIRATNKYLITPHHPLSSQPSAQTFLQNPYQLIDNNELQEHRKWVSQHFGTLKIPNSQFVASAPVYDPTGSEAFNPSSVSYNPLDTLNPQTTHLLERLQLENYISGSMNREDKSTAIQQVPSTSELEIGKNEEEIEI